MLHKSTIQLLRFPFSLFLAPVYFFALSMVPDIHWGRAALVFFILHALVYPASNGYNSYMDRDETPVGGLALPPKPTKELFYATMAMDAMAVVLSFLVHPIVGASVTAYILASRAYSYRGVRLKKYPILGYLTVIIFQGGLCYFLVFVGCSQSFMLPPAPPPILTACMLIGGFYPLTQIYQHDVDKADGVRTISAMLGYRGTFVLSSVMYTLAMALLGQYFWQINRMRDFFVVLTMLMPVLVYFFGWAKKVWKNPAAANFNNTMRMNVVASLCTSIAFIILLMARQFE